MRVIEQRLEDKWAEGWGHWLPYEGWDGILTWFFDELDKREIHYEIHQIKEKFGGLRMYIHSEDSGCWRDIEELVAIAEAKAAHTCEYCGEPGELRTDRHWMKTLCDEHAKDKTSPWTGNASV